MSRELSSSGRETARVREAYGRRDGDDRYSWFNGGHQLIIQGAERAILGALKRAGVVTLEDRAILEVGCGTGQWLRALVQWGARPSRITGVDLLAQRVAVARSLCASDAALLVGTATALPFRDGAFDIVLQSTVFTSILDDEIRRRAASELLRVLRRGGVVLWYDFFVDNPRNPDVRAVRKRDLVRLFPECTIDVRRTTLAPPLARRIAPRSWLTGAILSAVPVLCTHYAGTIRRSSP